MDKNKDTPTWIQRWVGRVEGKFPECMVRCSFSPERFGYLLEVYFPKEQAWSATGNWRIWGILLNPSNSPTVWQNRKAFRDDYDVTLREELVRETRRGVYLH